MNTSIIRYILGQILRLQSVFLLLPSITAIIYKEDTLIHYITVSVCSFILGSFMTWKKPADTVFYLHNRFAPKP